MRGAAMRERFGFGIEKYIPMRNFNHDLVQQLSEHLDGLWRFDEYLNNAKADGCERCTALWGRLRERLTADVKDLRDEIENHVKGGVFE